MPGMYESFVCDLCGVGIEPTEKGEVIRARNGVTLRQGRCS